MKVLIAGCGYVGTELGLRLGAEGHEVWGLRRDPSGLPEPIRPLAADLLDPHLADRLPEVDHVVYAAAANVSSPEGYRTIYVRGVENLLAALAHSDQTRVERFLFVSSTAVYGDSGGDWVDERTPPAPENFRGSEVLDGEHTALESSIPAAVLRLGGIYGPGRTRLIEMVRRGRARCPGEGPIWSNRIHRDDAAEALRHLLTLPTLDPIYLGVDDHPTPLCKVYRGVAQMVGAPEPTVDPELGRDRSNKRCSNRLLRESGFTFAYPSFREGYRALLATEAGEGGAGERQDR
ncbi:MAG: SDR family oxidoreductase [Gemmatimonadales bacterium]|nr:MAG: SDR family oxidoreductase [Gemmatimonadales bacterium]